MPRRRVRSNGVGPGPGEFRGVLCLRLFSKFSFPGIASTLCLTVDLVRAVPVVCQIGNCCLMLFKSCIQNFRQGCGCAHVVQYALPTESLSHIFGEIGPRLCYCSAAALLLLYATALLLLCYCCTAAAMMTAIFSMMTAIFSMMTAILSMMTAIFSMMTANIIFDDDSQCYIR